jgi:hypothetical protein
MPLVVPVVPGEEAAQPGLEHPVETTTRTMVKRNVPVTSIILLRWR